MVRIQFPEPKKKPQAFMSGAFSLDSAGIWDSIQVRSVICLCPNLSGMRDNLDIQVRHSCYNTSMKLTDFFKYKYLELLPIMDSDMLEVVELVNDAFSYQDSVKGETRTNLLNLRELVSSTDFFVIKYKSKICACVYIEANGRTLHLGILAVGTDYRGKGLAQAIMNAIEDYAKSMSFETLGLAYMSLAPWLKSYYEKYGFTETGEIQEWGAINLIWMSKSMHL